MIKQKPHDLGIGLEKHTDIKNEILQPKTPSEYIFWFEEKLNVIREHKKELEAANLLHIGISKYFHEELFPLYRLLQNKLVDWEQVKFIPTIGNQNFDVEVQSDRMDAPKYIEITTTAMNENEHNRMEYFLKNRHADLLGEVSIERKPVRKIDVENVFAPEEEINQSGQDRITKAIDKKINVPRRMDRTALLVYFDDYIYFRYDCNSSKYRMDIILSLINKEWAEKYSSLYLVGASGKSFWEKTKAS